MPSLCMVLFSVGFRRHTHLGRSPRLFNLIGVHSYFLSLSLRSVSVFLLSMSTLHAAEWKKFNNLTPPYLSINVLCSLRPPLSFFLLQFYVTLRSLKSFIYEHETLAPHADPRVLLDSLQTIDIDANPFRCSLLQSNNKQTNNTDKFQRIQTTKRNRKEETTYVRKLTTRN